MNIQKILCAVDFSSGSEAALNAASRLAGHFHAELLILHVIPFEIRLESKFDRRGDAEEHARSEALKQLRSLSQKLGRAYEAVKYLCRVGDAESEILEAAAKEQADLLVLGSHGRGGWRAIVFGSVTEAVLRHSELPVFTVPAIPAETGGSECEIKRILCPTDFSRPSTRALSVAAEWAREFDAEIQVLHVIPFSEPALGIIPVAEYEESRAKDAAIAVRHYLEDKGLDDCKINVIVKTGPAAPQIVKAAEELEADLIVIATHGESGWRHLVFGSVMEAVARTSRRAVLTVHEPRVGNGELEVLRASETTSAR